jgi:hypothetical protein
MIGERCSIPGILISPPFTTFLTLMTDNEPSPSYLDCGIHFFPFAAFFFLVSTVQVLARQHPAVAFFSRHSRLIHAPLACLDCC